MSHTSQIRERGIHFVKKRKIQIVVKSLVLAMLLAALTPPNTGSAHAASIAPADPALPGITTADYITSDESQYPTALKATEVPVAEPEPAAVPAAEEAPAAIETPAPAPAEPAAEPAPAAPEPKTIQPVDGNLYPYADVAFPNEESDPWGMYKRQCVSYTAWKVSASGRNMPYWGGVGNANQWPDDARNAGIPVDGNPQVGDVAIQYIGVAGHAMYVEAVNGDGTIEISQYNGDYNGNYSTATVSASGLSFIHFPL